MTRQALIREAKAILDEAYEVAAEMVMLYLDDHPSEPLQSLCKEIDPDNWNALRQRVQRAQARREAALEAEDGRSGLEAEWRKDRQRKAKLVLREANPAELRELIESLPAPTVKKIAKASTDALPAFSGRNSAPLDISGLPKTGEARLNRWLQEGKDLWERYGDELSPSRRRRFVDKVSAWVAKVAAEEMDYIS